MQKRRFKHLLAGVILLLYALPLWGQVGVLDAPCTLEMDRQPLASVLAAIEANHPVTFSYDSRILPQDGISCSFQKLPLRDVLDRVLGPVGIQWDLKGNILVLTARVDEPVEPNWHVISGYVEDATTGERLVGAQVMDLRSKNGTLTNNAGFFSLRLRQDSVKLVVSMLGYDIHGERFYLGSSVRRIVHMAGDLDLAPVVITDRDRPSDMAEAGASVIDVPLAELERLPSLMGESDVVNLLRMMPGVHQSGDGSQGFYVRGGGPDQNLILLDGATVYNASHLFGFYSIFNSDALKDVKLVKGGFPARYGGRLSSVVDIQAKDGNLQQWEGGAHIGLVSARVMIGGPIVKGKTSCFFSARRTILEPYFALINKVTVPQQGNRLGYSFLDLQGKVQHIIGTRDRLILGAYVGGDRFASGYDIDTSGVSNQFDFGLRWSNKLGSLQWRHEWNNKLFSHFYLLGSEYIYEATSESKLTLFGALPDRNSLQTRSSVRDIGTKMAFDWMPNCHNWIRMGVSATNHLFQPENYTQQIVGQANDTNFTRLIQRPIRSWEYMAWAEDQIRIGKVLNLNLGGHFSAYQVDSSFFWSLQPRASVRLTLPHSFGLQASYTEMVQYIHLLSNSGVGLPVDLWVPATGSVPPQRSRQVSLGFDKRFLKDGWLFTAEAYYKEMRDLIDYQTGVNFLGNTDWQDLVEKGGLGWSRGIEIFLRKTRGRVTGWLGYTLSKTDRQFSGINFGQRYPYKFDRRHDLSTAVIFRATDRISFSANWVYATGNSITFPEAVYYAPSVPLLGFWDLNQGQELDVIISYGSRNSTRLQDYHRLDISMSITKPSKWGEYFWNVGIFNVYNRRNPYFLFLRADYSEDPNSPSIKVRKMSLLPILPEFNFGFKF
ncbi:MAG: TonB-dependent receptor [Bacteroidia bacterium]